MKKLTLETVSTYANRGQAKEQNFRYAIEGKITKADNIRHTVSTDCGIYQVKSAKATICTGTLNIAEYLANDKATAFAYVTDTTAYIMDKAEYIAFAEKFHTVDRESNKNGGGVKLRFLNDNRKMIAYLESQAVAQQPDFLAGYILKMRAHARARAGSPGGMTRALQRIKVIKFDPGAGTLAN